MHRHGRGDAHRGGLTGTRGRLPLHAPFYQSNDLSLSLPGRRSRTFHHRRIGNGLYYEALEVMDCLRHGRLESDVMPLDESLAIMETLDSIRAQWALRYPGE